MRRWPNEPSFEDVQKIADRIERAFAQANILLHKVAHLNVGDSLQAFANVQSQLLGFDAHAREDLAKALEEKRIQTLAHGDLIVTCVLSAAVALSVYKKQPLPAGRRSGTRFARHLRALSTTSASLLAFSMLTFYTVLGSGARHQIEAMWDRRKKRYLGSFI